MPMCRFWNRAFIEEQAAADAGEANAGLRWPDTPPTNLDFIQSR